jgi:antitoxin component YwqK of YwqJK toxin-antitoxin module/Tfp pilus assembly protein PilF
MRYILILAFALPILCFAQKNISFDDSNQLIFNGGLAHQEQRYDDAIEFYGKVNINDTNYALAQYQMAISYGADENYKKAQEILKDLLDYKVSYDFKHLVYLFLGNAYDMNKQPNRAIETYTEGLKLMPYQYSLLYNRGICYENAGKYKEAIKDYQDAIQGNVYHTQSHMRLGALCARMGLYDQAMLSFMAAIWNEPNGEYAAYAVTTMESIANGTFEESNLDQVVYENSEEDPYAKYNTIFENQDALRPGYKVKLSFSTDYAKQFDLFLKNNKYKPGNHDFWNMTYMKFFEKVYASKKYDLFILLTLASIDNAEIQAKVNAKYAKITSFYDASKVDFFKFSEDRYMEFEGKMQEVVVDYSNSYLNSIGRATGTTERVPVGNFYYYHPNGTLRMVAHLNEKGEPIGKWEIYNDFDGSKIRELEFLDPTTKMNYDYYDSGELYYKYVMKNELAEDTVYAYYRNGSVLEKFVVKRGMKNGPYWSYYPNGTLQQQLFYEMDVLSGDVKTYHLNGALESECTVKNGLVQGKRTTYYPNKQAETDYDYVDDQFDGPFKEYYSNGQLKEEGTYKKGIQVGVGKVYYSNGALSTNITTDESGKQTGESVFYDIDGKKFQQLDFTKGALNKITYFDKQGNAKELAALKGKKMDYVRTYPDGKIQTKGSMTNDLYEGKWEYFDHYGNLAKVENYDKGILVDTMIYYHSNGKVKQAFQIEAGANNGLFLEYNAFGDLVSEGRFKNNTQDKEWFSYYPDGTIEGESYYLEGTRHGYQIDYNVKGGIYAIEHFDNGKMIFDRYLDTLEEVIGEFGQFNGEVSLKSLNNSYVRFVGHYVNGYSDGKFTHYGPEGGVLEEGTFVNNLTTGVYKWFYEDGKLLRECTYVNGEKNGVETSYYPNGNKSSVYNYADGLMQGDFVDYHENGKENFKGACLDNERHGRIVTYGEKGEIAMVRYYDQGVIVSYSYLGTDGKEVTPIPLEGNEMNVVCYFKNGKKSMEHKRINGLIDGTYIVYHENGVKQEESHFMHGEEHGKTVEFYDTGKTRREADYEKGFLHGWNILYYPNGNMKEKVPYIFNKRHGTASYYSVDGKLIRTTKYFDDAALEIKKM